tara:strand:+ start:544 stop:789 length:246 start_codon:yes stop_codon:yes gene_type:complete
MTNTLGTTMEERLFAEVMEEYVITAELGHLAKDQKLHKQEMRAHFKELLSFINQELDKRGIEEYNRGYEDANKQHTTPKLD